MASTREVVRWVGRNGKRVGVTIAGFALLLAGLIMLVLPGPGWLAIFAGLALLATEYAWAERALQSAKRRAKSAASKARGIRRSRKGDGSRSSRAS